MGNFIFPAELTSALSIPHFEVLEFPGNSALVPIGGSALLKAGTKFAIGTDIVEINSDTNFPAGTGYFWVDRLGNLGVSTEPPIEQIEIPEVDRIVEADIPLFSSASTGGFTVSATSELSSTYSAWKAHDGDKINSISSWMTPDNVTSGRWTLSLPASQRLTRVAISTRGSTDFQWGPDIFTIEESADLVNWVVLGSFNVGRVWLENETIFFDFDELTQSHISIKVADTRPASGTSVQRITIGETEWFARASLVTGTIWRNPASSKFYQVQSGEWIETEPRLYLGEISFDDALLGFDPAKIDSQVTLSEGNNLATFDVGRSAFGITEVPEDAIYFEVEAVSGFAGSLNAIGVGAIHTTNGVGFQTNYGVYLRANGALLRSDATISTTTQLGVYDSYTESDILGIAVRGNDIWISKNGIWIDNRDPSGTPFVSLPGRAYSVFPVVYGENSSARLKIRNTANAPEGFKNLDVNLVEYQKLAIEQVEVAANTDTVIGHKLGSEIATWSPTLPAGATGGVVGKTRSTVTVRSSIAGTVKVIGDRQW